MKNDPAYVEHIARDQLNMGKPGETIIRFDRYQTSAQSTTRLQRRPPTTRISKFRSDGFPREALGHVTCYPYL